MPDQCHAVLKDYANAWDMTMSEVMYEAIRSYIHKHSECCGYINSLLTFRGVKIDKGFLRTAMVTHALPANTEQHAALAYTKEAGR